MNIFTLFLFRRMCQNLLISALDAGTRHFWHTSLAKGIDIRKEIKTDKDVDTVLGCWVINHDIKGRKDGDRIKIYGSYDINIWYSYDGNTKTDVISKKINYQESVKVKIKENGDLNDNSEILIYVSSFSY